MLVPLWWGLGGIISPPRQSFFLKRFPAFLNFSLDVYFIIKYVILIKKEGLL